MVLEVMNFAYCQIYSVLKGVVKHKILVLNGVWAVHMDPVRNIVIEPLADAICGKQADIEHGAWSNYSVDELLFRAHELRAKRQYSLAYNCEDFIEELLGNAPRSPQRNIWIAAILCGAVFAIAAKR
ncbi:MAG: hypothetical protein AAFX54_18800 [Pseudomonadota bacterium]